ncbi:hypothetical protein, conserved [Leishmania tarentolae]|uniref:Rab-GAP TBC domain-containing protein n=1 Tax=Leishmania tarentolae TaxID=5689 RepID=A0A640KFM3_LEITA|nr:hypothetical protein, conserved [Leishmania tarentolae]
MPLSPQDLLQLLNQPHSHYEVFEQISLVETASGTALSSRHVPRGSVVVPEVDKDRGDGGGVTHTIPIATAVVRTPSLQVLQLPRALAPPQASLPTQGHGTMYVCELPEDMWDSISAVTAASAPSQRQLAFADEAPVFCASENPSFVNAGNGREGESAVRALSTTARVAATNTVDHTYYAGKMCEKSEKPSNRDGNVPTLDLGAGSVGADGGIQLPQLLSATRQCAVKLTTSAQEEETAGTGSGNVLKGTKMGCREVNASSTPTQSSQSQPRVSVSASPAVQRKSDTVTVVLWVAAEVATTKGGDSTDREPARDAACTFGSSEIATPRLHCDSLQVTSTVVTPEKASAAAVVTAERTEGIAGKSSAELPRCLCFAVRDIHEAESHDTDMLTPRDRRVQLLTLQLKSGATAYATNCTADVLVCFDCSPPGRALASPWETGGGAAALTSRGPAPNTFSFVFHKGGITRCMAALRHRSPGLLYACRGGRNNLSLLVLGGAHGAAGADGSSNLSPPQLQGAVTPSELPTSHPVHPLGSAHLGHLLSAGERGTCSAGVPQTQPAEGKSHGWRKRLSTRALIRSGARGVSDLLSHYTANLRDEAMGAIAPQWLSLLTTLQQEADHPDDRRGGGEERASDRTHAWASTTDSPEEMHGHSSNSSFEDLTEEMTAIRLGACYSPPRPVLPLTDGIRAPSPVTGADWERVFDVPWDPQRRPCQHGDTAEGPTTDSAASTAVLPQTKRLNVDRWHAFRQAIYERGGLSDSNIRFEVWCYLLGAYAVGSTEAEQAEVLRNDEVLYTRLTSQWKSWLPEQEAHFAAYRYAKQSIVKDVQRTDRTHAAFREDESDRLRVLQEVLLAHVMLDMDFGYSQGMSDVAAVVLLAALPSLPSPSRLSLESEAAIFMCFRKILSEHMSENFLIEARTAGAPYATVKGLQRKLYQVQVLTRHFNPGLYTHLTRNCMADDMSFCFRWILVCFKRDLPSIEDTMRFWDVLFACPYTKSYEVVVTVALLSALAAQIVTHVHAYETLLQFVNGLNSEISLDQILVCARAFYEDVCIAEVRELRRHLRLQAAGAATTARGSDGTSSVGEPFPDWYVGPHRNEEAATAGVSAGKPEHDDNESDYFPSVEDMVELFLKTDGPL